MKLSKLTAAVAATTFGVAAQAAEIQGGSLAGVDTSVGTASHVSAVAVVAPDNIIDGLRTLQGIPVATCANNFTELCAPTISSAELRAIVTNQVINAAFITGEAGTNLRTDAGLGNKAGGIREYAAAGVRDALNAFSSSGSIGTTPCGQGNLVVISNETTTATDGSGNVIVGDAATLINMNAEPTTGANFGFIHASEMPSGTGFIKLDGVAPSLVNLMSSNYNLVSNLDGAGTGSATQLSGSMIVGVAATADGAASHFPSACSPLTSPSPVVDVSGGNL